VVAFLLAGCGGPTDSIDRTGAGATATPTVAPTMPGAPSSPGPAPADSDCPSVSIEQLPHNAGGMVMNSPSLARARTAVKHEVARPNRGVFAEFAGCQATNSMLVYRLPGHPDFDALAKRVISRFPGVGLVLLDSRWSHRQIQAAIKAASARFPVLAAHGIRVQSAEYFTDDGGYYEVNIGTQGDIDTARRLLADLGPIIRVDRKGDVIPD
jgi:hypothetical protein